MSLCGGMPLELSRRSAHVCVHTMLSFLCRIFPLELLVHVLVEAIALLLCTAKILSPHIPRCSTTTQQQFSPFRQVFHMPRRCLDMPCLALPCLSVPNVLAPVRPHPMGEPNAQPTTTTTTSSRNSGTFGFAHEGLPVGSGSHPVERNFGGQCRGHRPRAVFGLRQPRGRLSKRPRRERDSLVRERFRRGDG